MSLTPVPTKPAGRKTVRHFVVGPNKTEQIVLGVVGVANAQLQKLFHVK